MKHWSMLLQILTVTWISLFSISCVPITRPPEGQPAAATALPAQPATLLSTPMAMPGAVGIGDPYYPALGNGGYEVEHYSIVLDVQPVVNIISGTTTIRAYATQSLSALNLDFAGLLIDYVTVNGRAAVYTRSGSELTVVPTSSIPIHSNFDVIVAYRGSPQPIASLDHALARGWFHTKAGVINVVSEPDGAVTWFPSNNHPSDKATYRFEITVPAPFMVVASGLLQETLAHDAKIRYIWAMEQPMASYLAAINIGQYVLTTLPGPDGVIIRNYFPPDFPAGRRQGYAKLPEMIEFFSSLFGPYPFAAYGVILADPQSAVCQTILAAEIQTLSTHCPDSEAETEEVIVHELVHQWFGDSVSIKNWQDLWLKEGLTTYAQWLWRTRGKEIDVISRLATVYYRHVSLTFPIGEPLASDLFNYDTIYTGGALVFHALRLQVGDQVFFEILRTYCARFRDSNASTQDFMALAKEISGQDLDDFFQAWLFSDELPSLPMASP